MVGGFISGELAVVTATASIGENTARYQLGWGTLQFVTLGLTPK
jgi:hypothetical protein